MKWPDISQSTMEKQQLANVSVEPTAAGASGEVDGIFEPDPMCMLITVWVSLQASKNGSQWPSASWIEGIPEVRWDLAEAHGVHTACRVAPHLGRGQHRVPQRDQGQRDQPTLGLGPAPLLDHPVVVGLDAQSRARSLSLASENVWPQKRGNVGKHSDASMPAKSMSSSRSGILHDPWRISS